MKYLVACSAFISDEVTGCAPVYLDICIYIVASLGLMMLYILLKKIIKYWSSYKG